MGEHPLILLAVLGGLVALSEALVRRTWLRHLGTALLVIVLAALVSNLGLIPTYRSDIPVYGYLLGDAARVAIFLLLLLVDLRDVLRAGWPMLALFLIGALGTVVGVVVGMQVVGGEQAFGELYGALGGMFVGTYTGGSINFQAVAIEYDVPAQAPILFAGANAVDAGMTTVWMALSIALPRFLAPIWPRPRAGGPPSGAAAPVALAPGEEDREAVAPSDLGLLLLLGTLAVWGSDALAVWSAEDAGLALPSILILTTLALVLAQTPFIRGLRGARLLGMFGVYLFLAVIGVLCDAEALRSLGDIGWRLFVFVSIAIGLHGLITFAGAYLLRLPPDVAAVASQANVGGGTSALALARSLGRPDLVLPSILVGSVGTAIGTYLGLVVAGGLG